MVSEKPFNYGELGWRFLKAGVRRKLLKDLIYSHKLLSTTKLFDLLQVIQKKISLIVNRKTALFEIR